MQFNLLLLPVGENFTEGQRNLSTNLVIELHVSTACKVFVTMAFVAINKFNFFFCPVLQVGKIVITQTQYFKMNCCNLSLYCGLHFEKCRAAYFQEGLWVHRFLSLTESL